MRRTLCGLAAFTVCVAAATVLIITRTLDESIATWLVLGAAFGAFLMIFGKN